jgi:hypothetical protein
MTISRGSLNSESTFFTKDEYYKLEVYNPVKKATYSFTSSNKSIVTLKAKGSKAYLTGVKVGTATITCNQKLNGKTTKVGTCKVTVKKPKFYSETYDGLPLGSGEGFFIYDSYRNFNATYTFTSNSKNFTLKERVKKAEGADGYQMVQSYTAKKAGTYTVTVKETYNKKTTTIGEMKYEVKNATVLEEQYVYLGESAYSYNLINNYRWDVSYLFDAVEKDILEFYVEEGNAYYKGKNVGTVTVNIYEDTKVPDKNKLIGSCKITVKDYTLESIDTYIDGTETNVGGSTIGLTVYKYPYAATETITVTSSDTKIATVSDINTDNYCEIKPVGEGTVTITITCGEFTKTETITVYADENAEDDSASDEDETYEW